MSINFQASAPVFNIQTYCIHDGPGIRSTVFVKGCPLRCLWCANPESQLPVPQLMTYSSKCTGCGKCVPACPRHAISIVEEDERFIAKTNRSLCNDCGMCTSVCFREARELSGKPTTVQEAFDRVMQDKMFYVCSGGGVTISGGEALAHADFSANLFAALQNEGIHTAIESCCFATRETVDKVFAHVNLGLLDIKCMDPVLHKQYTGHDNSLILSNIRHIYHDLHVPMIIRVPIIPGYNSSDKNISETAAYVAKELGSDVQIHLLPYHRLGVSKSESLGKEGALTLEPPSAEFMNHLLEIVHSYGLAGQIGG